MNKTNQPKLEVSLVPANAWGINVRAIISEENWFKLRQKFGAHYDPYSNYPKPAAPLTCEACKHSFSESLHLHEIWDFDDKKKAQTLIGFSVVCENCHNAIHMGRANKVGLGEPSRKHLKTVNSWSDEQLFKHLESASSQWTRRLGFNYILDVSYLINQELLSDKEIHLNWLKRPARVFDRVGAISWARDVLASADTVILDTETTGLVEGPSANPNVEIVELAIIAMSGKVLYNSRFKPLYSIPRRTMKIHGITNTMVRRCPSFADEYPNMLKILQGKIVISYNTRFDSRVLTKTRNLHKVATLEDVTWECAMKVFKAYLEPSTMFVSLPNAKHGALEDCKATLDLIYKMSRNEEVICDQQQ